MIARRGNVWLVLLAVCAFGPVPAPAGADARKKATSPPPARAKPRAVREVTAAGAAATRPATTRPVKVRRVRYRPPRRGAPITREASAARGAGDPLPNVMVLAPEHTGLTTRAQPTFAWHQDRSARTKLILTLTNEKTFDTLMALKLRKEASAGVHSLELADVGLALDANVDYKWSVGIITGREHASGDPYSAAHVMRVAAPAELARRLSGADRLKRVSILAEEGIWYDALGELCGLVRAFPGDGSLQELRTQFLRDAGVLGLGGGSGGSAGRGGPGRAGPATRPAGPPQTQPARPTGGKAPTTKPAPRRAATTRPVRVLAMRYRPPKRGAPVTRETSASRRSDVALPNVFVLAPKHTGLTRRAHPVLAWYQDKPARATFVLTLTKADELDTVLELKVMKDAPAGHHRFDLARLDLPLETGVEYKWSIGVMTEDEHTSGDPYSSACILKTAEPSGLDARLAGADKLQRVAILAEAGVWYDALAELWDLIDASPDDQSLQKLRTRLLADAEVFEKSPKADTTAALGGR